MNFEEWSNRQKERQDFARYAEKKSVEHFAAENYSAPFVGVGESARTGIARTQPIKPAQPTQSIKSQPEIKTTPAKSRGGISLHPGIAEVDQKAKESATAKKRAPESEPQPQVKAPGIPSGQANKLGIEPDPTKPFTFSSKPESGNPGKPFFREGAFPVATKAFRSVGSASSEIPKSLPLARLLRLPQAAVGSLPGWEARTGMPFIPSSVNVSPGNLLEATPLGAYTNNWDIEGAEAPVPAIFATMDDETLSQLITEYSDQMRKLKSQGLSGLLESGMWDNLSEPQKVAKPAIFASPQPPEKDSNGKTARDFGVGGKSLSTLYDTGFVIGNMANLYDEDSFLVNGKQMVEDSMKELAGTFAANDPKLMKVATEMIDRFISGSGDDYSNPVLTQKVLEHPNTQNFIDETMETIQNYLNHDGGDLEALKLDKGFKGDMDKILGPNYSTEPDLFGGLTICLNGTWGYTVDIADYQFDGKDYSGTLRYTLYDHFGLDEDDISGRNWYKGAYAPFAAWYVLQYYEGCEGKYKPFVTYMNFEVPFSGSIN